MHPINWGPGAYPFLPRHRNKGMTQFARSVETGVRLMMYRDLSEF